jgi:hypothetical protein
MLYEFPTLGVYMCEKASLAVREEHMLIVFEKKMLSKIFEP